MRYRRPAALACVAKSGRSHAKGRLPGCVSIALVPGFLTSGRHLNYNSRSKAPGTAGLDTSRSRSLLCHGVGGGTIPTGFRAAQPHPGRVTETLKSRRVRRTAGKADAQVVCAQARFEVRPFADSRGPRPTPQPGSLPHQLRTITNF